jgi:phenylacetate-CoA ligase
MPIYDPTVETADRGVLNQIQLERLQAVSNRVYRHVPYYRKKFDEVGMTPAGVESLGDVRRLPKTDWKVLMENRPHGLFAVPMHSVVRLQVVSGGLKSDVVVGYTRNDVRHWTQLTARTLCGGGVTEEDVVQIILDYDLFSGALAIHSGAEEIGATVIPSATLNAEKKIEIMRNYRTTVLVGTPSHVLDLLAFLKNGEIDPKSFYLRSVLLVGGTWTEGLRREIEEGLFVRCFGGFAVPEVASTGLAAECEHRNGLHIIEDHFLTEVLDPKTGEPVPSGETGELVLTTLTKEAFPLIRYRTGQMIRLFHAPCACGRTLARMELLRERCDNMVVIGGVRINPDDIGAILTEIEGLTPDFRLIISQEGRRDLVELQVVLTEEAFGDEMRALQSLIERIREKAEMRFNLPVSVKLVESASILEGPRLIDRRAKD